MYLSTPIFFIVMKIAVTIVVGQLSQSQRLELESSQQRHDREAPASNSPIQLDLPLGRMGSRGYRDGSACLCLPHPCGQSEKMAEGQDLHFIMQKEAPRGKGGRETQWWSRGLAPLGSFCFCVCWTMMLTLEAGGRRSMMATGWTVCPAGRCTHLADWREDSDYPSPSPRA